MRIMSFLLFVFRTIVRQPARSILCVTGVALAMFLFCAVEAMSRGVRLATEQQATDVTLVVYRENRFCPFSSILPEDYARTIERIPGVVAVSPMAILVSNCRASLDVVTFRGVPPEGLGSAVLHGASLDAATRAAWESRTDAAILGSRIAARRGLTAGDALTVAGVTVHVAGIVESDEPQEQEAVFTHLGFLQRAGRDRVGKVTQFNVRVAEPEALATVAAAIDEEFSTRSEPTSTWPERAFVARAVADIVDLARFARWLGWGALVAVFALVANAIVLSVRERVRDHAVMQTLGYQDRLLTCLILLEGLLLSLLGGGVGLLAAALTSYWTRASFSVEGMSVQLALDGWTVMVGLVVSVVVGVLAALFPAWQATRLRITDCFRAV
jgi:putative ABC transport system permease protein